MKLLFTNDLHYNKHKFDYISNVIADYDVLVISGDLLNQMDKHSSVYQQVSDINKWLLNIHNQNTKAHIVVCHGNHDVTYDTSNIIYTNTAPIDFISHPNITYSGDCLNLDDQKIQFLSFPFFWQDDYALIQYTNQLELQLKKDYTTFVSCHAPPSISACCSNEQNFGNKALDHITSIYDSIDLISCGHVHGAPYSKYGSWYDVVNNITIINPGHNKDKFNGVHLDINNNSIDKIIWIDRENFVHV